MLRVVQLGLEPTRVPQQFTASPTPHTHPPQFETWRVSGLENYANLHLTKL
jgi:hypothetical protein